MLLIIGPALTGCPSPPPDPLIKELQQKVDALSVEKDRLQHDLDNSQKALKAAEERIQTLQGLPQKPFLFTVDHIELEGLTGGSDYDGQPGDDGVTAFIRPRDADGDILKAAGRIEVDLFDLTMPGNPVALARRVVEDEKDLLKSWYGKFLTNHYAVQCPWEPDKPPQHDEVLVRVTFTDYLTGNVFVDSKTVHVTLPPAAK
ncbi:MAG TPA: hypothetical protein VGM03_13355 [Phycisphaerae bacterium]